MRRAPATHRLGYCTGAGGERVRRVARREAIRALIASSGFCAARVARAAQGRLIRIGVTAVFPEDEVGLLRTWSQWLEERLQRPIEFVTRSSYREISDLIRSSQLDFAWICGYPYVRYKSELRLVAVPVWKGQPLYRSYIITAADNAKSQRILDLRGGVFAFSDPDSNSGHLYPCYALIRGGQDPDAFFSRTFYTWAHRLVVRAVAEGVAQAGAVDGYVYEMVSTLQPQLVARTRVIERSPLFGHTPIVARHDIDEREEGAFFEALAAMANDARGRELLRVMQLDGFVHGSVALYDSIAEMMRADTQFRESKLAGRS